MIIQRRARIIKVLLCNKFHYIKGGSETYYFSLKKLLQSNCINTIDFSMKDVKNYPSDYSSFFIENVDYNEKAGILYKLKAAVNIIYSFEAKKKLKKLINIERPDIAHLHVFQHQLSPSIIGTLKKSKIPIVYTAHDLKCLCANYKMLFQGKICEACKDGKHRHCFEKRCVKNSRAKSFINTVEMYLHSFLKSYQKIDAIITPSKFYQKKFIEYGYSQENIFYLPNFINLKDYEPSYETQNYFIYLGRLSEEKGLITLLKAMQKVEGTRLLIIGSGPMESEIKSFILREGMENKIELAGFKSGKELEELVKNAMFSVIPSEWYENAPYSLLETMAFGKPAIGADIGGIPDIIEEGENGLLFSPGDSNDLADKINMLLNDKSLIIKYGQNARAKLQCEYNPEMHFNQLKDIYTNLIAVNCKKNKRKVKRD